jgi:hypothetical protein
MGMDSPHSRYPHVFAVVRFDLQIDAHNACDSISVVKVFASVEQAELEATRLRKINDDKNCVYRVQTTRFVSS